MPHWATVARGCGRKKRLASRAVENLKQFLNSRQEAVVANSFESVPFGHFLSARPWLKVAHGSPELLGELKAFLLENPEARASQTFSSKMAHFNMQVTKDTDMTAVASLLEAPPSDSWQQSCSVRSHDFAKMLALLACWCGCGPRNPDLGATSFAGLNLRTASEGRTRQRLLSGTWACFAALFQLSTPHLSLGQAG